MAAEDPLRRLQILQRDLIAATDSQLRNIDRLSNQLDASVKDLEQLLERNKQNEASRALLKPKNTTQSDTVTIDGAQWSIQDELREHAIQVAAELDLDELEAVKLCIQSLVTEGSDHSLALRAVLRFHEQRQALLECMRLLLQLGIDPHESDELVADAFRDVSKRIVEGRAQHGNENKRPDSGIYWRRCIEGLTDIEGFVKKISEYKDKLVNTGQGTSGEQGDALRAQRLLLTRQHESLAAVLLYLIRGNYVQPADYRHLLTKAAALDSEMDIVIHYLPVLICGASHFASDHTIGMDVARDLHMLFVAGPAQLRWKQPALKAAATVCWLAEYSARFSNGSSEPSQNIADRKRDEDTRSELFFDCMKNKAFHFMLAAAAFLKPVRWYDPSRTGIIDFLVDNAVSVVEMPRAAEHFSAVTMHELQEFVDAFVTNMPNTLRKLKSEEDDKRRNFITQSTSGTHPDLDLERFMVIMACAYHDDIEAAGDFWSDKESNLFGFLRWVSQRLPTPRVAAFCQLLRAIACDDKSANQAHRFLLEDAAMTSGRMRKAYAVSWSQIFSELELYASNLKDRPAVPQAVLDQDRNDVEDTFEEPETGIMLDSYLGLAAHVCRASPDARNWLLKDQPFHLGEVMFQLARSATVPRVRACCLDMLAALLTDRVLEVRNGIWVLLDTWILTGGLDGSNAPRVQTRLQYSAKQYLQVFANNAEAGVSLLSLLNALVAPSANVADFPIDTLPFPENLGAPHRHAGMEIYVDFVMDSFFARKVPRMPLEGELSLLELARYECLHFVSQCLLTFNEDLVLLANTTNVGVESAMETKSLTTYARLHPFARAMEWIFDKGVVSSLFATLRQNLDTLDNADPSSPVVRATLKCIQVLNLAWKMQPTYFDIVRPIIASQISKAQPATSSTLTSVDDIFLTHLHVVEDIAQFTACKHLEISLESIELLQRIGSSRKLCQSADIGKTQSRRSNRLIGLLTPISTALTVELQQDFELEEWDLETEEVPLKLVKARATLELLHAGLDASNGKPGLAHLLLGLSCHERAVDVLPGSRFATSQALFHVLVTRAAELPIIQGTSGFVSSLLSVKRRCLEIVLKLAVSPLTARIVQPQLRAMDFLPALTKLQIPVSASPLWDGKPCLDPHVLLDSSAVAIRDFMHIRKACFEFAAADLREAHEQNSFSIQEKIVNAVLGSIKLPTGEELSSPSIFELFDFFDLDTAVALEPNYAQCTYLGDVDLSGCTKNDSDTLLIFDINLAHELLTLRKKELKEKGTTREASELDGVQDELQAILASLTSQNSWRGIQAARLAALEAWTDLVSILVTKGNLAQKQVIALSVQGLLLILPKLEKSLVDNMEAAALLAKLTLTLTHVISPALHDPSQQTVNVANERLIAIFRISLKFLTDSSTDLTLRDVCYRTSCAILGSLPASPGNAQSPPSSNAKQLLQLAQNTGDRLLAVATEDAFSGRGVTRVSALLFLDGLVSLFRSLKVNTSMLRALMKLNFVPVLIDNSIGSVAIAFGAEDEMVTNLAYYHAALALLLRLCQTPDGTQLVLNSGFFSTIDDSKLFSTDPDVGFDVDNPDALKEFYSILADLLRVITAAVISKGPQPGLKFLQQHRYTVQALFKQAARGNATEVADELGRLILATEFLEEDEVVSAGATRDGFT